MDGGPLSTLIIILAAALAGAINAMAGGGTFLTFPALTGLGQLTEKIANMTSTVGLWPGSAASVTASLPDIKRLPRGMFLAYSLISLVGGSVGALLLVYTSDRNFRLVIPWLLAFATLIFAFSRPIARWAGRQHGHRTLGWTTLVGVIQFAVAIYGGYFGAGIGVLMIAAMAFSGLDDIHQMNALKVALATIINGVACLLFIVMSFTGGDSIAWQYGPAMAVASAVGGFLGMHLARRIPQNTLRSIILLIAVALTAVYFYKAYA